MRLDTPTARQSGDYDVIVDRLQYGDPEARIHLDESYGLVLQRVSLDDCERAARAFAAAAQEIRAVLAEAAAPHGTKYVYKGRCQLCGKPEDDALHAEPKPLAISDSTIQQAKFFAQPGNTIDDMLADQAASA